MKKFIGGVYFICFRMEIATLFEQTWSKKLSVQAENWYSDEFEYEEFIGDIYFSVFNRKYSFPTSRLFLEAEI